MGRSSVVVNGEVRDIVFREKHLIAENVVAYSMYLGDQKLGYVHRWRDSWTAVSNRDAHFMPPRAAEAMKKQGWEVNPAQVKEIDVLESVDGFRTRRDAGEYLLKHHGIRKAVDY